MPLLYPGAKWHPLKNHSAPGDAKRRNMIVLHITDGSTAAGAIAWFEQSQAPHRVSAHFVIDRDGTVFQLLGLDDTAWHASTVNSRSVGIEHAGTKALPCTEEQYEASAKLVAWLADKLGLPISRGFIRTHYEAAPKDGHVGCCTDALDPDKVVAMAQAIASRQVSPPSSKSSS